MSRERELQPIRLIEGYQPRAKKTQDLGYQPQGGAGLDPKTLKPPRGDTAIQPPKPAPGDTK